jgi:glutamine synthetase
MEFGLGWAAAGQSLTPFAEIAPNPWGPIMEVRQIPDPTAHVCIDTPVNSAPFDLYLCDSKNSDGSTWECCTRGFARQALKVLESEHGLQLVGAFEHEFTLMGNDFAPGPPHSLEAMRVAAQFTADLSSALTEAGLEPETIEPEYGYLQYEVTTAPDIGIAVADRAILTREVIREVARWHGMRATFSPKPTPNGVGNGAHIHFSFADSDGRNVTFDSRNASQASSFSESFIAGVMDHMQALVAFTAPSPVSYLRLGPHNWSCGFASFGIQNREAAIRICPSPSPNPEVQAKGFNLEFRPVDATASAYMVIGALIQAGLDGVARQLPLPASCDVDPADLSEAQRAELGISPLPSTLGEALQALSINKVARSWMSETMYKAYTDLKRMEIRIAAAQSPDEVCSRHAMVY